MASIRSRRRERPHAGLLWLVVATCALALVVAYWGVRGRGPIPSGVRVPEGIPGGSASDPAWREEVGEYEEDDRRHGNSDVAAVDSSGSAMYEVEEGLQEAASDLVMGYEAGHQCLLCHAGYVDLLGTVWGCVVQGPGWVDVCVVRQKPDGGGSVVRVVRLEAPMEVTAHGMPKKQGEV